ncbi:MAG: NAD(+) diphosphatase [Propionibacteriaceae bacterium]|nr:NAD(+) diphosphatase [Propionibacteriaceae bacterium]
MNHWRSAALLDRLPDIRDDERALAALAAEPSSRLLWLGPELEVPVAGDRLRPAPGPYVRDPADLLLGRVGEHVWWARRDGLAGTDLRYLNLTAEQLQVAMMATALFEWHATCPCCLRCGGQTAPFLAGAARRCQDCLADLFPRTDPAVILAVTDHEDRLLLTHAAAWTGNRVSIQAGFIEAGESAEQACHREIYEETGLLLEELRFVGTQPWPFPRSLMLGFETRADAAQLHLDERELAWGQFHTRAGLRDALDAGAVTLPGPISLARQLIEQWLARGG